MINARRSFLGVLALSFIVVITWASELTILWPDIEQGACMLVVGPETDGVRVGLLIDAGTGFGARPEVSPVDVLRDFIRHNPNVKIRYVVITHYHLDHYSWIDDLQAAGVIPSDAIQYTRENATPGQEISLGDGAIARFVVVGGRIRKNDVETTVYDSTNENDLSIGTLISYKNFQAWVGGDLSSTVERRIADLVGDVDVYVMHHHGSRYSSSSTFLDALKPEVAICQVGDGNRYGHPTDEAIGRVLATVDTDGDNTNGTPIVVLQNRGRFSTTIPGVYISDPDGEGGLPGTIKLTTDGTSYSLEAAGFKSSLVFPTDETSPLLNETSESETSTDTGRTETSQTAETPPRYRLIITSNKMPVYHSKEYWVLIVYPVGESQGAVLCTKSNFSSATVFEKELYPGDQVKLWIVAVDQEADPDVGQTLYTLKVPALEQGQTYKFTVNFWISGESGGQASITFQLQRL